MKLRLTKSKTTIIIIILIMIVVSSNLNWGKDNWKGIIESDGKGYYAYLPAIFIYKDLNFGFFDKIERDKYYDKNLFYDYRSSSNGRIINKYYCGTALVELPFFLVAHISSYALNFDRDGYSKLYPIMINIGALFYLLIGLICLNSILSLYEIAERQKSLVLLASVFGTNLFYYTIVEPGMSHIYSFAFISVFFYFSKRYFLSFHKKYILILAISYGIIVLIRPINGLILLILPFAAGNFKTLKQGLEISLENKPYLIFCFCIVMATIFIQFIYYKIATGHFFVYSYGDEGFNFLSPHIIDILFSYKKGLFLYTPIFLISLTGGYFLWKSSKFEFYSWFAFFLIITYFLSSWWMWFYGGSFSSRVYVEYISLFMILLGISLNKIKSKSISILFTSLIIALIIVCQIQTYQYRYYDIHWSEMTKEKYWNTFLRIDRLIK